MAASPTEIGDTNAAGQQPAATGAPRPGPVAIVCGTISVAALFLLCAVMSVDVFARYVFVRPLSWSGEVVKFLMSIIFFTALPIATLRGDHVVVDILSRRFTGTLKRVCGLAAGLVSAAVMGLFAWHGFQFAVRLLTYGDRTYSLRLPLHYAAWAAAAAFAVSALIYVWRAWRDAGRNDTGPTDIGRADIGRTDA
jgi:TRAP-type C4-dicarboxylate transport system permease small subunit